MSLVLLETEDDIVVRDATPWCRARARVLAARWDRELAEGASPDAGVELSLRAAHLATAAQRTLTARAIWRTLDLASDPGRGAHVRAVLAVGPRARAAVLACAPELRRLAAVIDSPEPVSPRGLALARQLATDGGGPLHYPRRADDLHRACRHALACLTPGSSTR